MDLPFFVQSMDEDGDIPFTELKPRPRKLLELWQSWRADGARAPFKAAIDPVGLGGAGLMPDVWIIGEPEPSVFKFSLAGERMINTYNQPLRGKTVGETFDAPRAAFANYRYERIIHDQCIEHSRGPVLRNGKVFYYAHRLILPLRGPDGGGGFAIGIAETEGYDPYADMNGPLEFYFDEIVMIPVARLGLDAVL